jgi:uncharacterized protein YdcH (DUF465 family)
MSQDEFTELFQYMSERFDKVDTQFEKVANRFDSLDKMIDKVIKGQEIADDERLVMGHQLDRLDRWVHEVADKIGYKLSV